MVPFAFGKAGVALGQTCHCSRKTQEALSGFRSKCYSSQLETKVSLLEAKFSSSSHTTNRGKNWESSSKTSPWGEKSFPLKLLRVETWGPKSGAEGEQGAVYHSEQNHPLFRERIGRGFGRSNRGDAGNTCDTRNVPRETQARKSDDAGLDSCPATDWLCELSKLAPVSSGLQFSHPPLGLLERLKD